MKIICKYCKKPTGEIEPFEDEPIKKAKCSECLEKERQQEQDRLKAEPLEGEKKRDVIVNGWKGYLTIAGKESPNLSLWEIAVCGKPFFCTSQIRKDLERLLEANPSDTVDVTVFHSMTIHTGWDLRKRKGRNKKEKKPIVDAPKKEATHYNCTIQVPKDVALQLFDGVADRNFEIVKILMDSAEKSRNPERIPIDENVQKPKT